ncbi:helix-turn-helix domain-containing protein [Rhizobium laguerreae]|uniref:helix-turn-helix transcriptional regulator n=1 Tax=Rhizobium laguerreae TaxID=1076926 RepID=UPI001C918B2C|nr:helix-turn-helix domain-containing protein [Rhizobium laguerreae]MBY3162102.1 helix-turn-helix domain-containing protein [Rhizobium laguerreae]
MGAVAKSTKYLLIEDLCDRFSVGRSTIYRWIREDKNFPDPIVINGRRYFSEHDVMRWEVGKGGPDPDLEGRVQGLKPVSGVITEYDQLVEALRTRRTQIGMSSIELDARSGMQEGYTSKLENFGRPQGRGMGPEVFPLWLGGLKVGIILVDLPRRPRKGKREAEA